MRKVFLTLLLIGFAPLFKSWHPFWGWTIRFLGSGEVCGDDLGWIAAEDFQEDVGQAVAKALDGHPVKTPTRAVLTEDKSAGSACYVSCQHLDLDGVKPSGRGIQSLLHQLQTLSWQIDARAIDHCWQIDLPVTWTEYLQNVLGRSMRKKVRRLSDRYLASGEVEVHTVSGYESWVKAWGH